MEYSTAQNGYRSRKIRGEALQHTTPPLHNEAPSCEGDAPVTRTNPPKGMLRPRWISPLGAHRVLTRIHARPSIHRHGHSRGGGTAHTTSPWPDGAIEWPRGFSNSPAPQAIQPASPEGFNEAPRQEAHRVPCGCAAAVPPSGEAAAISTFQSGAMDGAVRPPAYTCPARRDHARGPKIPSPPPMPAPGRPDSQQEPLQLPGHSVGAMPRRPATGNEAMFSQAIFPGLRLPSFRRTLAGGPGSLLLRETARSHASLAASHICQGRALHNF